MMDGRRYGVFHSELTDSYYACWVKPRFPDDPERAHLVVAVGKKHNVTADVKAFIARSTEEEARP